MICIQRPEEAVGGFHNADLADCQFGLHKMAWGKVCVTFLTQFEASAVDMLQLLL